MADPTTVTIAQVRDALAVLGIVDDFDLVVSVTINSRKISVVRQRLNENGRPFLAGDDEVAINAVTIGVRRPAVADSEPA